MNNETNQLRVGERGGEEKEEEKRGSNQSSAGI
jgi:hypothetical protein